jgi:hypothetical protein
MKTTWKRNSGVDFWLPSALLQSAWQERRDPPSQAIKPKMQNKEKITETRKLDQLAAQASMRAATAKRLLFS